MEIFLEDNYSHPKDLNLFLDEPLCIHQRSDPTMNRNLVLFVHGLGGSRYGVNSTWGNFPKLMFKDIPDADIGMYQYRTGKGRIFSSKSVSLSDEARVLADLLRDQLVTYDCILFAGHSMGGLLCKAAIHVLVQRRDLNTLARICGLILMATPQLGSLRMPGILSGLSHDARALRPHGPFIRGINRTFEDHVALDENEHRLEKTTIPTWAVEGVHDFWVDSLSSSIGLASSRRKVVRGSHTSIVKPPDRDADVYKWVFEKALAAFNRFQYDVFVAAAMAGHEGDAEYRKSRKAVLALINVLKNKCGYRSVFYAGETIGSMADFDPEALALQIDLQAMRRSKNFIMYYPKKLASSTLYEAGWALMLGKPSIYIVNANGDLPFLLNDAGQAFEERRVRIFKCSNTKNMLKHIEQYGDTLFSL